ncbi:MAG: hypothetical protein K9M03_00865 [Kiritimatiellales bacterium]|nr:hypothetical protein [Kiritimatiellales bacterium]
MSPNQPPSAPSNQPTPQERANQQINKQNSTSSAIITSQLRESIKRREVSAVDVAEWPRKPWLAYDYLTNKALQKNNRRSRRNKVSQGPDPQELKEITDPNSDDKRLEHLRHLLGDDVLKTLAIWSQKAREGDIERETWERDVANATDIQNAQTKVASLHSDLESRLESYEKTEEVLNTSKQLNPVEKFLRGTKEYVWDDFKKHPEMSVGLVVLTYLAFRTIQKTNPRLWTMTKISAAAIVAGAFVKSKFGIEPTEWVAEQAERFGWQSGADGIRTGRDTVGQILHGPKGEGTVNNYYYERLGLGREKEQIVFDSMLTQSPAHFLSWYNNAKKWRMSGDKNIPKNITRMVDKMCEGKQIPSYFKKLPPADRVKLTLDVADSMFKDIAEANGKDPEAHIGIDILQGKYVDGTYFDQIWADWERDIKIALTNPALPPDIKTRLETALQEGKGFCEGMKAQVQNGASTIKLMDVLYVERASEGIPKFDGAGKSVEWLISEGYNSLNALSGAAYDAAKSALDSVKTYVTKSVPKAAGEIWSEIQPMLINDTGTGILDKGFDKWEDLDNWLRVDIPKDSSGNPLYVDAAGNGLTRLENTIDKGTKTFWVVAEKGKPLGDLLIATGVAAGEAVEITLEQIKKFAEYIKSKTLESGMFRVLKTELAAGADTPSIRIEDPEPGFKYQVKVTYKIRDPISGATSKQPFISPERWSDDGTSIDFTDPTTFAIPENAISAKTTLIITDNLGNTQNSPDYELDISKWINEKRDMLALANSFSASFDATDKKFSVTLNGKKDYEYRAFISYEYTDANGAAKPPDSLIFMGTFNQDGSLPKPIIKQVPNDGRIITSAKAKVGIIHPKGNSVNTEIIITI